MLTFKFYITLPNWLFNFVNKLRNSLCIKIRRTRKYKSFFCCGWIFLPQDVPVLFERKPFKIIVSNLLIRQTMCFLEFFEANVLHLFYWNNFFYFFYFLIVPSPVIKMCFELSWMFWFTLSPRFPKHI